MDDPQISSEGKILDRVPTGIRGLDDVLGGGFPRNKMHLIQGNPGTGKTTLGLQYLMEGALRKERGLFVTLINTEEDLFHQAHSHGWSLDGIDIFDLSTMKQLHRLELQQTVFRTAEIELTEMTKALLAKVEAVRPARMVLDSLSEIQFLAGNILRFRHAILALKQDFWKCTVLLLDDGVSESNYRQIHTLAHSVTVLEQLAPPLGTDRRRLRVLIMRDAPFRGGFHDFKICTGGIHVFPKLVAAEHRGPLRQGAVSSGVEKLDFLLGGGLACGASALLMGPTGAGKSIVATQYAVAAAMRGEQVGIYMFEESLNTFFARCKAFGMNVRPHVDAGRIVVHQLDPAELSPGEFTHRVCNDVNHGAKLVIIDSLNGFLHAMPEERLLTIQLHELLTYLGQKGVTTLLVGTQHGVAGENRVPSMDMSISYLADAVILLQYFEFEGEVRQMISIFKNRTARHQRTFQEIRFEPGHIDIGEPLKELHGVLSSAPAWDGEIIHTARHDDLGEDAKEKERSNFPEVGENCS